MSPTERIQDAAIGEAKQQYVDDGLISVSTYIRLRDVGLDADIIIDQIENGDI